MRVSKFRNRRYGIQLGCNLSDRGRDVYRGTCVYPYTVRLRSYSSRFLERHPGVACYQHVRRLEGPITQCQHRLPVVVLLEAPLHARGEAPETPTQVHRHAPHTCRHLVRLHDYLSQFPDLVVTYIGQSYEAYNSTVAFMNRFKNIDSIITLSFHPIESRIFYRNDPCIHNLQPVPVLIEDRRKQNPAAELLENNQKPYQAAPSGSDDGEHEYA